MGPLFTILLALCVLILREYGVESGIVAGWAAAPLALLPYLCSGIARAALLRGRFSTAERWQRLAGLSPALAFGIAVCGLGWISALESRLGHKLSLFEWPTFDVLLCLAPYVLYELAGIDARARLSTSSGPRRNRLRVFQMRMFLSTLLPLVAYVGISSAVGANEHLRVGVEEIGLWHALYAGALLVLLVLTLPFLLSFALDTTRVPEGPLRVLFDGVAQAAGFRAREILVWNTGGNMANAAIVGLGARTRIVLFSDVLLAQLDARELAAVYAHEIAHARRHHVPIFVAWVLAFFLGGDLLAQALFSGNEWLAGSLLLASMAAWFLLFGWLSRRYELEADLYSIALLGDTAAMVSALERVGGALRDLASWRHFSTARRVEFLERAAREPELARRFLRRLHAWSAGGVLLFLLVAGLEGRRLVQSYAPDRVRAHLRLGEYAQAQERASGREDIPPELRALVARGVSIEPQAGDPGVFEARARAALAQDDLQAALEYLQLGVLRGKADLEPWARSLEARLAPHAPQ